MISQNPQLQVIKPATNAPIKAVTLVTHGFNLQPARLHEIVTELASLNHIVVQLTLTGHDGNYANLASVTRDIWLGDMQSATLTAAALSTEYRVPLIFVGISLGALLNVDLLNQAVEPYFSKRVLIVPAIRLHWYTHLIRLLNLFPLASNVPSRSPASYRVHPQLPIAAYNAVFKSVAATKILSKENLSIPTLIFSTPTDELVSHRGLKNILSHHPDASWQLISLNNSDSMVKPRFAHNCVDSASMGHSCWEMFLANLRQFLESA